MKGACVGDNTPLAQFFCEIFQKKFLTKVYFHLTKA
jgi:hypothetical protein